MQAIDAIYLIAYVLALVLLALGLILFTGWMMLILLGCLPRLFPKSNSRYIQAVARLDKSSVSRKLLIAFTLGVAALAFGALLELAFPGLADGLRGSK